MVSKLNAEKYPEYSYRFGVRGFPTIFWFPAGSQKPTQEYWGERSAQVATGGEVICAPPCILTIENH
jgi:hypothetical protein